MKEKGEKRMENFEKVINEIGFGAAAVRLQEELPPDFWNSLNVEQCREILITARSWNSKAVKNTVSRLEELNPSRKVWTEIYDKSSLYLQIGEKIREMLRAEYASALFK